MTDRLLQHFPLWAAVPAALTFWHPAPWTGLKPAIVPLLALVMFAMGLSLTWGHFRAVLASWWRRR